MTKERFWILFMKNKLQLQDFTYLINILKDNNKWIIEDLTEKLGIDIE